ncbi:MAG: twin-arginine translocase TatA/TatE family subunit [Nitrososphaerales archaeon]
MVTNMIALFVMGYEWLWLILIGGIVIFGAKKIPEIAKSLGKAQGEFEKGKIEGAKEIKKMMSTSPDDRVKLSKAAESLGIDAEGLTNEELKEAINKALSKQETNA